MLRFKQRDSGAKNQCKGGLARHLKYFPNHEIRTESVVFILRAVVMALGTQKYPPHCGLPARVCSGENDVGLGLSAKLTSTPFNSRLSTTNWPTAPPPEMARDTGVKVTKFTSPSVRGWIQAIVSARSLPPNRFSADSFPMKLISEIRDPRFRDHES